MNQQNSFQSVILSHLFRGLRGGSRTDETPKMEHFVIIVNG